MGWHWLRWLHSIYWMLWVTIIIIESLQCLKLPVWDTLNRNTVLTCPVYGHAAAVGGYCIQPNQCLCHVDYTGVNCEIGTFNHLYDNINVQCCVASLYKNTASDHTAVGVIIIAPQLNLNWLEAKYRSLCFAAPFFRVWLWQPRATLEDVTYRLYLWVWLWHQWGDSEVVIRLWMLDLCMDPSQYKNIYTN